MHAALLEREQNASRDRAGLTARLSALEESLSMRDGGAAILEGRGGTKARGRLSGLISVHDGWEAAVAAALGPLAESVVVSDLASAVHAVAMLKTESAGQSELLVVEGEFNNRVDVPGGLTTLTSLIDSADLNSLVETLLTGFVAVRTIDEAKDVVERYPRLIAVTQDGDLISRNRVRGGSSGTNSAIEISAMIERTRASLSEVVAVCDSLKFEVAAALEKVEVAQKNHDRALAGLNESDAKMSGLAEQMAVAGQNVKNSQAEVERLGASLTAATAQRESDESDLQIAIAQFESHQIPQEPDRTNLEKIREQVNAARAVEVEARLEVRTIEERITAVSDRAKALEDAAQAERDNAIKAIARMQHRAAAAKVAQEIADLAYEALIQIEVTISKALAERERLEKSRTDREGETLSVRGRIRELTTELEHLTSSVHRDEIARAEQRMRIEQLEGRAIEELGIDVPTLIEEYRPDNPVPTLTEDEEGNFVPGEFILYRRDQQEKRLAQAERNLALLGKINPLALEEYTSHEERLKYLAEQLEDLKKTKKDLLDIIKEVDDKVEQIFTEAYHDTAREFEKIFARLFPGGDGRLILTDPSNMMLTGVDVEARPPGKRVKRLSLLSGGERSLVAVAMLVAIFKARPSPFYVMDEVEAALDDTNLSRLLGVFEELRETSQLIIITHQKRTMEIADALYGVTMRGDGVSEVISQRLRESESV